MGDVEEQPELDIQGGACVPCRRHHVAFRALPDATAGNVAGVLEPMDTLPVKQCRGLDGTHAVGDTGKVSKW